MTNENEKFGVLLLNMGGPGSIDEVQNYIYNLLADPLMIRMPFAGLLQKPFARIMSRSRAPKVKKRYELIGGKSPIADATAKQAELLSLALGLPVTYAMRYTAPRVSVAVDPMINQKVDKLVVIPLYPQYSTVSTLSSIRDFEEVNADKLAYKIIDRHYDHPIFVRAMAQSLDDVISRVDLSLKTCALFVAHSIPEAYIKSGDPYAVEVEKTAELICSSLSYKLPHSLAYQSRVGPIKWRGPTMEEELDVLVGKGFEQLIVQPLSFVSENLETLFDLDIEFRESCQKSGINAMYRVPTLGASQPYIDTLADIATRTIAEWSKSDA